MRHAMDSDEICKLLDCLIGYTEPVGETNADRTRLHNLKKLIDVVNYCLDGVKRSAEVIGYEYSVIENKMTAQSALTEWRDWINEVIQE